MKRHVLFGGGAALLLLVIGGVWLSLASPSSSATGYSELSFEPLPEITASEAVRLFEDDAYLMAFIERHGPEGATTAIRDWGESVGVTHCHDRAHEIGRMAYDLFGTQAFAYAGHSCKSGAMHGVTESLLAERGTEDLAEEVAVLCATVVRDFFRHQCVHGVGHGLLGWVSYELPDALELCDRLTEEADRVSCYSGVFMENISGSLAGGMVESGMDHAGMHHHGHAVQGGEGDAPMSPEAARAATIERSAQYLHPDDPHYPCDVVEERYVDACYSVQTYHMLTVHENDFGAVARECESLPTEVRREICFSSLGRDVGNHFPGDPETAIETCGLIESHHRLDCLEEVVQDWFWEEASAGVALDFCQRLDGFDENVRCYWQIAWRASDLYETPREYRSFCGAFQADYSWLCDFVLFQRLSQFAPQGRTDWIQETPTELREAWSACRQTIDEDTLCEILLFQQLEAFHRARIEGAVSGGQGLEPDPGLD